MDETERHEMIQKKSVDALLQALDDQTVLLSSTAMIERAPAFVDLVRRGSKAIPDLLQELAQRPSIGVVLILHKITGVSPVPEQDSGNLAAMAGAWVKWGRGYAKNRA